LPFALSNIDVKCEYGTGSWYALKPFECKAQNYLNITSKEIANIVLAHSDGSSRNNEVIGFNADDKGISYFPRNLNVVFPNINAISIQNGRIKEIGQSDLQPFTKLEYLELGDNDIEILEDDLFIYNPKLWYIRFSGNKIFYIGLKVFDNLPNLSYLRLYSSKCINTWIDNDKAGVQSIIQQLKVACKDSDYLNMHIKIKTLANSINYLTLANFTVLDKSLRDLKTELESSKFSSAVHLKVKYQEIFQNFLGKNINFDFVKKSLLNVTIETSKKMENIKTDLTIELTSLNISISELVKQTHANQEIKITNLNKSLADFMDQITKKSKIMEKNLSDSLIGTCKALDDRILILSVMSMESINSTSLETVKKINKVDENISEINASIDKVQNTLLHKLSKIEREMNEKISSINTKIDNLSKILKESIDSNSKALLSFRSNLDDRMKLINYKMDNNFEVYDLSKCVLYGICGLLGSLVLMIIYKKILFRSTDDDLFGENFS